MNNALGIDLVTEIQIFTSVSLGNNAAKNHDYR